MRSQNSGPKSSEKKSSDGGIKIVATNPFAFSNFSIEETVEAGLVLQGTEAKSLRLQAPTIRDAHVEIRTSKKGFEAWLLNSHIGPYSHGNIWNHASTRPRKLLLHQHQLRKLHGAMTQKGLTIVPLKLYFKGGRAKVEIGYGRGKKKYDQREDLKKRDSDREIEAALKAKNKLR